jgi:hypothetical protein
MKILKIGTRVKWLSFVDKYPNVNWYGTIIKYFYEDTELLKPTIYVLRLDEPWLTPITTSTPTGNPMQNILIAVEGSEKAFEILDENRI